MKSNLVSQLLIVLLVSSQAFTMYKVERHQGEDHNSKGKEKKISIPNVIKPIKILPILVLPGLYSNC